MSTKSPGKESYESPRIKLHIQAPSSASTYTLGASRSRRLLIPTAHETNQIRSPVTPVRRTKSSSSGVRLTRVARGDTEDSLSLSQPKVYASQKPWWSPLGRFRFIGHMEVEGY